MLLCSVDSWGTLTAKISRSREIFFKFRRGDICCHCRRTVNVETDSRPQGCFLLYSKSKSMLPPFVHLVVALPCACFMFLKLFNMFPNPPSYPFKIEFVANKTSSNLAAPFRAGKCCQYTMPLFRPLEICWWEQKQFSRHIYCLQLPGAFRMQP